MKLSSSENVVMADPDLIVWCDFVRQWQMMESTQVFSLLDELKGEEVGGVNEQRLQQLSCHPTIVVGVYDIVEDGSFLVVDASEVVPTRS